MFLIFIIETLFGVFYFENLIFVLRKIWIDQNWDLLCPNLALFGPNLAQNVVFRLFLPNAALNVPNIFVIETLIGSSTWKT